MILWKSQTTYSDRTACLILGGDNNLYLTDTNYYIQAYRKDNGDRLWRYLEQHQNGNDDIAFGSDNGIYMVSPYYGVSDYSISCVYSNGTFKYVPGDHPSYLCIDNDGTIYVESAKKMYAYKPGFTLKWELALNDTAIYYTNPALCSEGSIVIGSNDGYVYKISSSGQLKWRNERFTTGPQSLTVDSVGRIYGCWITGDTNKRGLYCINPDGTLKFFMSEGGGYYPYGQVLIGPEMLLYVVSADKCCCYGDDGTGFEESQEVKKSIPKTFKASPNPFNSSLDLELPNSASIYTLTGLLIEQLTSGKHRIDTSSWKAGMYLIRCGKETRRVVKVE